MIALLVVGLLWLNAPVVERDSTQCDVPTDTSGLIEELAVVKDSLTSELLRNPKQLDDIRDATKMIDPQPSPSDRHEKLRREIILFSIPGCEPCERWKRTEQPRFESDGWQVVKSNDPGKGPWPYFLIERNGRTTEHRGYLPFAKVDEVAK